MNENEIKQKLDQLAEYLTQRDTINLEKQAPLEAIYTPEIKAHIAEIEAEFSEKIDKIDEKIAALETEIKQSVITYGASVKGSYLQAIYARGRVSWDTKSLDGYAAAHPELLALRKKNNTAYSGWQGQVQNEKQQD